MLRTACRCILKFLLGLGLLIGLFIAVLLALPDGEEGEGIEEHLSGDAQVGHWQAAYFCDDEERRAERILKATNYVARVVSLSHGHTDEEEACKVVRQSLILTHELHQCVIDLWRRRGVTGKVTPDMLRQPQAWWNAVLVTALKSAPTTILDRSQALHKALMLALPWAIETLLERKVQVNRLAGPCQLTPMLLAARMSDSASVQQLYRADANVSATDCRGCLPQDLAADPQLAFKLRTWHACGPASPPERCLRGQPDHLVATSFYAPPSLRTAVSGGFPLPSPIFSATMSSPRQPLDGHNVCSRDWQGARGRGRGR